MIARATRPQVSVFTAEGPEPNHQGRDDAWVVGLDFGTDRNGYSDRKKIAHDLRGDIGHALACDGFITSGTFSHDLGCERLYLGVKKQTGDGTKVSAEALNEIVGKRVVQFNREHFPHTRRVEFTGSQTWDKLKSDIFSSTEKKEILANEALPPKMQQGLIDSLSADAFNETIYGPRKPKGPSI